MTSSVPARLSQWLAAHHALLIGIATVDLVLVVVLNVPGNPFLDLNPGRYRVLGTILSHGGVLALALGFWERRRQWLDAAAGWSRARQWVSFALAGAAVLAVLHVLARIWPRFVVAMLRESGLVEPLQFVLYLVGAWIAYEHVALLRSRGNDHRPYQLVMAVCVLFALEEVDFLGIFGAIFGSIEGVYVGTVHDLVNLATNDSRVWVGLSAVVVVALVVFWRGRFLTWAFLRAEVLDATSLPIYLAAVFLGIAQVVDIQGGALPVLRRIFRFKVEEPFELLGALFLNLGLLMKYSRDRRSVPSRPPP